VTEGIRNRVKHSEFIESQANILAKARRWIADAQERMAEHYNKNRRQQTFKRGDEVMLSGEYLSVRHLGTTKKKFGARWVGPFEVTKCIGRGHYQLRLPPGVRIHPIFHTSIMKPYITAEYRRQNQKLFKVRLADGTEGELVEDILNHKRSRKQTLHKVKWLGQSRTTWEPATSLTSITGHIDCYHERRQEHR
ncbi:hypothetical protein L914_10121, partial [Phytophthora nicotianae]